MSTKKYNKGKQDTKSKTQYAQGNASANNGKSS